MTHNLGPSPNPASARNDDSRDGTIAKLAMAREAFARGDARSPFRAIVDDTESLYAEPAINEFELTIGQNIVAWFWGKGTGIMAGGFETFVNRDPAEVLAAFDATIARLDAK